jgi:hypothetical protein
MPLCRPVQQPIVPTMSANITSVKDVLLCAESRSILYIILFLLHQQPKQYFDALILHHLGSRSRHDRARCWLYRVGNPSFRRYERL